jgi:hypothetical protein
VDRAACVAHVVGERVRDGAVVGDRRRRRVQARDAGRMRLELAQRGAVEPADARDAVRGGAALELVEPRQLGRVDGDDELPASVERQALLLAVRAEQAGAAAAQRRLERAGGVIDARVDDAAVPPRLVERELGLLLEDGDRGAGSSCATRRATASPRIPPPTTPTRLTRTASRSAP